MLVSVGVRGPAQGHARACARWAAVWWRAVAVGGSVRHERERASGSTDSALGGAGMMRGLAVIAGASVGLSKALWARRKRGSKEIKSTCAVRSAFKKSSIVSRSKSLICAATCNQWRHGQEKVVLGGEEQRGVDGRGGGDVHGDVQRGHVERVRRLLDGVVVEHVAEVHVLRQHVVCDGQEELGRAVGRAGGARIRASGQPNVSAPRAAQAPAPARRRRRRDRQSSWRRRGSWRSF